MHNGSNLKSPNQEFWRAVQQASAPHTEARLLHTCHDAGQSPLLLVLLQLLGVEQLPMLPQRLIDSVELPVGAASIFLGTWSYS